MFTIPIQLFTMAEMRTTKEKELSFLTRFPGASKMGVVSVRIRDKLMIDAQIRIVISAIASLDPRELVGGIVVVEPGRARLRRGK